MCISPVHAGIKLFNTANSSFIFDLRRRSIRLCAVLRAIFLPAALVALGCFFLPAAADAVSVVVFLTPELLGGAGASWRGFIWIIFLDRVGGGGKAKESFWAWAVELRRRDLTVSLG